MEIIKVTNSELILRQNNSIGGNHIFLNMVIRGDQYDFKCWHICSRA